MNYQDENKNHLGENWQDISLEPNKNIYSCYSTIHHAVQFIAIIGKSYLKPQQDDSQSSFFFEPKEKYFYGEWICFENDFRVEFCPKSFILNVVSRKKEVLATLLIKNKSRRDVYARLKLEMARQGMEAHRLLPEMHYDLPYHQAENGGKYAPLEKAILPEVLKYYSNANIVLTLLRERYAKDHIIRCWPHHFDMALVFRSSFEIPENCLVRIGFSPPDTDVSVPYFYFKIESDLSKIDGCLGFAGTEINSSWRGAVLPLRTILKPKKTETQFSSVINFYEYNFEALNEIHRSFGS